MRQTLYILFTFFALALSANAQKLTVESFEHATNDISALVAERRDLNDKPCALIKVGLAVQGAQFQGNVMGDVERKVGEYWVYMTHGSRTVRIVHDSYLPLKVTFADYGIEKLESGSTYELMILLPNNAVANNTIPSNPQASSTLQTQPLPQQSQSQYQQTQQSQLVKETETFTVNGVTFDMIRVEGGTFTMGATPEQGSDADDDEKPAHKVTLSDYYIGKTEVTQALWQAVMGESITQLEDESIWSTLGVGDDNPMYDVYMDDFEAFIRKLNLLTGRTFRLPTEAEWEYAARGGNKSKGYKYSGSNNISDVAWYDSNKDGVDFNYSSMTHPVGTKAPNELGIYDMSGNVWEWCSDKYSSYDNNHPTATSAHYRVYRGGSSCCGWNSCRNSARMYHEPYYAYYDVGLRLALSE